jgi:energy-coupling factor transporter transmembrane protein EcfT
MMVLRFFAGPIVHNLKPLPLLAISAVLAIVGLYTLSFAAGMMIFAAATLYAFGKTFFWPTMLGVVSEQTPRGGALTLNAISGLGMLAVGTLGFPYIGTLQADKAIHAVATDDLALRRLPGLVKDGQLTVVENKSIYEIIDYKAISDTKLNDLLKTLPEVERAQVKADIDATIGASTQGALANMAIFPAIMLAGYIILIIYFQARGGYKQVHLDEPSPQTLPPLDHPHGVMERTAWSTGIKE